MLKQGEQERAKAVLEITSSLKHRATDLWGEDRAKEILPVIKQVASDIWQLSQGAPASNEEPEFYL